VDYKLNLISQQAAYELTITSQKAIDTILLQSNQAVDLLSIYDNVCKVNRMEHELNLMTLKVDSADIKKVQLKMRTAEGQQGSLNAFVIEKKQGSDDAMCALLEIPLKPLNLHERITGLSAFELQKLPLSRIVLSGRFSQQDGLQWISNCIPNVPNVISDSNMSTLTFTFRSSFTKTYLIVEIEEGAVTVQSDNFSVMTIFKDQLSADASQRKIALDIQSELN